MTTRTRVAIEALIDDIDSRFGEDRHALKKIYTANNGNFVLHSLVQRRKDGATFRDTLTILLLKGLLAEATRLKKSQLQQSMLESLLGADSEFGQALTALRSK